MRIWSSILIGLISGYLIGMALMMLIGQMDFPLVHRSFGYTYLPYVCAIGGMVIGLVVWDQRKRK